MISINFKAKINLDPGSFKLIPLSLSKTLRMRPISNMDAHRWSFDLVQRPP